jgi:hypothetical protein
MRSAVARCRNEARNVSVESITACSMFSVTCFAFVLMMRAPRGLFLCDNGELILTESVASRVSRIIPAGILLSLVISVGWFVDWETALWVLTIEKNENEMTYYLLPELIRFIAILAYRTWKFWLQFANSEFWLSLQWIIVADEDSLVQSSLCLSFKWLMRPIVKRRRACDSWEVNRILSLIFLWIMCCIYPSILVLYWTINAPLLQFLRHHVSIHCLPN